MFVLRNKLSVLQAIVEYSALAIVAVSIYLAIGQPLFWILLVFSCLLFLCSVHKSNFVILKKEAVIYRKYLIWRKIKYNSIKILLITKQSYMTRTSISDFHDKATKQILGCIFLMKDISLSAKDSLRNSVHMYGEWSNTLIDFQYKSNFLETVLTGGFDGEIYITDEMDAILGADIKNILNKMNFDVSRFKVIQVLTDINS